VRVKVDDTRARLLKAAAEIFAEQGFEKATIRQICTRAAANVALINYHFGDKLELFTEVLRSSIVRPEPAAPPKPAPCANPEEALRQMIHLMVERAFETSDEASLRFRLMMHEFFQPTAATARVVDEVLRPVYDRLREMVAAILKLPLDDEKTRLCVHSILGQVAHYSHSTTMLNRLWPELTMTPGQRDRIANHIADFTLAYLHARQAGLPVE
jgi:AcrR family transcriptional regulator